MRCVDQSWGTGIFSQRAHPESVEPEGIKGPERLGGRLGMACGELETTWGEMMKKMAPTEKVEGQTVVPLNGVTDRATRRPGTSDLDGRRKV